jgi:hypothetical protein
MSVRPMQAVILCRGGLKVSQINGSPAKIAANFRHSKHIVRRDGRRQPASTFPRVRPSEQCRQPHSTESLVGNTGSRTHRAPAVTIWELNRLPGASAILGHSAEDRFST